MDIPIGFTFTKEEETAARAMLLTVRTSPYRDYEGFEREVRETVVPQISGTRFADYCAKVKQIHGFEQPFIRLANCPVDLQVPPLSFDKPVEDKRRLKTTFVAEGFLLLYAILMDQVLYAYQNTNDGDIFQDIRPMRELAESQSQKTLGGLSFHKDDANHYVRPLWFNILGIQSAGVNVVNTCYSANKEILAALSDDTKKVLASPEFITPHDDLTSAGGYDLAEEAQQHPILGGDGSMDLRFFEKRTVGASPRAQEAVDELLRVIHAVKTPVNIQSGDFVGAANNACLHNREVSEIKDLEQLRGRWLIKTASIDSLDSIRSYLVPGSVRVVKG
ncbi:hypothetical protein ACFY8S_34005 [Streptomyces hygroscopicus]|uniref:hypothetical protein n=1 Tax=Streptomyces hygroscopicus TaxID=1912 RepID=UPI0036A0D5B9